jgi:hypothetical protein
MMYFMNENYREWFYRKWVGTLDKQQLPTRNENLGKFNEEVDGNKEEVSEAGVW